MAMARRAAEPARATPLTRNDCPVRRDTTKTSTIIRTQVAAFDVERAQDLRAGLRARREE